jgi:hypothetical protein
MKRTLLITAALCAAAEEQPDVALVLRGISSPRRYDSFRGRVDAGGWRATHCDLRRRFIEPFGADVFLHTWAGAEAAAVVRAYAPVAAVVEPQRNFSGYYKNLVAVEPCDATLVSTGQRCPVTLQNKFSMFWSLREAARVMAEHEDARGKRYAFVLNTRFDVRFRGARLFLDRAALAPGAFYGVVHPATPGVHPREFVDDKLFGAGSEAARAAGAVFDLLPDLAVNTPYGALKSKGGITNRVEEIANVAGAAPFEFSNHVNLESGVLRLLGDDASVFRHLCDALRDDGGGACALEAVSELYRGGDGDTACAAVACVDEGCLVHIRRWHLTRLP